MLARSNSVKLKKRVEGNSVSNAASNENRLLLHLIHPASVRILLIFSALLCIPFYYMEESVLLGTKPLVDSIRHFIRDQSGVFSVCHLC